MIACLNQTLKPWASKELLHLREEISKAFRNLAPGELFSFSLERSLHRWWLMLWFLGTWGHGRMKIGNGLPQLTTNYVCNW